MTPPKLPTPSSSDRLQAMLAEGLRPVAAPEALWDRVWQPRVQSGWLAGWRGRSKEAWRNSFAFGLPVAAAAALISMVALADPVHSPSRFRATVTPAQRGSSQLVSQVVKRDAVLALAGSVKVPGRKTGHGSADAAGCALCHAL